MKSYFFSFFEEGVEVDWLDLELSPLDEFEEVSLLLSLEASGFLASPPFSDLGFFL